MLFHHSKKLWSSLYSIVTKGFDWTRNNYFWVLVPTGERINFGIGNNITELWGKVKHDKEVYFKILMDAGLEGETKDYFR